jgi:GAF domain-containing protein
MSATDYLRPFVEVNRALCDGVDNHSVMSLIARRIAETLQLKGFMVKMKSPVDGRVELLTAYGLSEHFLFSDPSAPTGSACIELPDEVVCYADLKRDERGDQFEAMLVEGVMAMAIVPIEIEQQTTAMAMLFSPVPREFDKTELSFAQALTAEGVLSFLWGRRVEESVERERQYLLSFQEISHEINATLNINKVLELVVNKVARLLKAKGCAVRLLDPQSNKLYLTKSCGLSESFLNKGPVDAQKSIAENMAGKILIIDDVFTDPRLQYRTETIEEGVRKILSIPLMVRGKVTGVLRVYSGERPPYSKREIQFATAIAQQCAFAIENARIYQRVKFEYQQLLVDFGYEGSSQ